MVLRLQIGLGLLLLVVLAAGGGYFYGVSVGQARAGLALQQSARGRFGAQGNQTPNPGRTPQVGGQPGGPRGGGGVMGTIESVQGNAIVVNAQGQSVQVNVTDTTLIEKLSSVGVQALSKGEQVTVSGTRNDDGSITARSIQSVRPFGTPQPSQP